MTRCLLALLFLLGFPALARGQDPPHIKFVQEKDTLPAGLVYAAGTVIVAAFGTLGTVIAKLYFGGLKKDDLIASQTKAAADSIAAEKDARRAEVERLLREHQALLREVLTATVAKTQAYGSLAEAVAANTKAVNDLIALVGQK